MVTMNARYLILGIPIFVAGCRIEKPGDADVQGPAAVSATTRLPERLGLGTTATAAALARIDIDVNPSGAGLPPGDGDATRGATLYVAKCALCHGLRGEGQGPYPRLIGTVPRAGFAFATDAKLPKTVGNYWPYATTLYDYVHRAMPLSAPGSLAPTEVYSLVAYLLAENQIIPGTAIMNASSLPKVKMPARAFFVPDDRRGGQSFR